jgi:hypothetical protein
MNRSRQQRRRPGLGESLRKLKGDPGRLQVVLAFGLLTAGIVAMELPLSHRLKQLRAATVEARERVQMARDVVLFFNQVESYESLVAFPKDTVNWQGYVLERLGDAVVLMSVEPNPPVAQGPFSVVDIDVKVRSNSYQSLLDLVHRLEHGDRALRIEELRLERQQTEILMSCVIRGLVKRELSQADPEASADGGASSVDDQEPISHG